MSTSESSRLELTSSPVVHPADRDDHEEHEEHEEHDDEASHDVSVSSVCVGSGNDDTSHDGASASASTSASSASSSAEPSDVLCLSSAAAQHRDNTTKLSTLEMELSRVRSIIMEREKELMCHMMVSNILDREHHRMREGKSSSDDAGLPHDKPILQQIIELLPPSYQYPEVTCARLKIGPHSYATQNFAETQWSQIATVVVNYPTRQSIGTLQVYYLEEKPIFTETNTPFMPEEQSLLNVVAERIGQYLTQQTVTEHLNRMTGQLNRCRFCGSIEDESTWRNIWDYIRLHSGMDFSKTMCPECQGHQKKEGETDGESCHLHHNNLDFELAGRKRKQEEKEEKDQPKKVHQ
eukprot:TRINITY_DN196_c0_g1_i1.p1 TRINITY_DN196_c0_g1~~TRINITY_DN196_c0_g1_i1.p1  ORF type:complete len:351 (+),score=90.42 TRINITY_DN196_c0_g1_i1:27-1079(+)